jgi:hypothetical protein
MTKTLNQFHTCAVAESADFTPFERWVVADGTIPRARPAPPYGDSSESSVQPGSWDPGGLGGTIYPACKTLHS